MTCRRVRAPRFVVRSSENGFLRRKVVSVPGFGGGRIGIRLGSGEGLTSRVAHPTLFGLTGINPPPSAVGLPAGRIADPTLFGLTGINPPPSAVGLPAGRIADPTLFGLTGINPPPSAVGLPAGRVADPTLFGLTGINPPSSAVGLHALGINGGCRKEDGSD
jgi:hypothetical protein